MRYSHQRERIFRAVTESSNHPTANVVYDALKLEMPKLSLGTVYRNLNQLVDAGRLRRIPLADGGCRFDKVSPAHSHLVCDSCGAVSDMALPAFAPLGQEIERQTGFTLRSYDVVLRGVCHACGLADAVKE